MTRFLLAMVLMLSASLAQAAGSGGGGQAPRTVEQTPEQAANSHYKSGLRYKKRAWKHEEKAAAASTAEKREKLLAKAAKAFEKAVAQQLKAMQADPQHFEAANELGYGLRRLGGAKQAIEWYDLALQLKPDFFEAVEYRGEAYLATGNLDGAKAAYMELFRNDRALAEQLLDAMERWLVAQDGAAPAPQHSEFSAWVVERRELVELTRDVSLNQSRDW
ncbi:MAG: hypothetical protein OES38_14075 [Gammaproteobacteria bacterium]|nr:hypothetical protein [Gammaproteobacteria bacterium]